MEQIDDATTLSAYDNLNRLVSQAPGGPMVVAGSLNEPGTVTISGMPAIVDANNNFRGSVPTTSGTNTFTIVAKDVSGNTTTQQYQVTVSGSGKAFTYDANGNLSSDGTRSFAFDARNRPTAITVGNHQYEFSYDGLRTAMSLSRNWRLLIFVLVMIAPLSACERQQRTMLSCPSPDGRLVATYFALFGGGAAGWVIERIAIHPNGEVLDPDRFVFAMRHGVDVRLHWKAPDVLLIEYPDKTDIETKRTTYTVRQGLLRRTLQTVTISYLPVETVMMDGLSTGQFVVGETECVSESGGAQRK